MGDFVKGVIAGLVFSAILVGVIAAFWVSGRRDKELIEYGEKQQEIEVLREEYINRDPLEFLEIPGVRGAADGVAAEFLRKRDEALQRLRDRPFDR